jgi:hypothetical protein
MASRRIPNKDARVWKAGPATSTSGVALKVWRGLTPTLIMTMLVLGHLMLEL